MKFYDGGDITSEVRCIDSESLNYRNSITGAYFVGECRTKRLSLTLKFKPS